MKFTLLAALLLLLAAPASATLWLSELCPFGGQGSVSVEYGGTFQTCVNRNDVPPTDPCQYDFAIPFDPALFTPIDVERHFSTAGICRAGAIGPFGGIVGGDELVVLGCADVDPFDSWQPLESSIVYAPNLNPQWIITWQAAPDFGRVGQGGRIPRIGTTGAGQDYEYNAGGTACNDGPVETMLGQVIVVPEPGLAGLAAGVLLLGWLGRRK